MLKKRDFLCPECLDFVNHQGKLIFFKSKISVLEIELQLKIKSTKSQPAKMICFLQRKCSGIFSANGCYFLNLKKQKRGRTGSIEFSNFLKKKEGEKRGVEIFPIKMEGLVKQVGLCVYVCVLLNYTISISIIFVSLEEPSLIASNQQIYGFYN